MKVTKSTAPINRSRIEPQSGVGFRIKQRQIIRVIDVEGEQVVDLFCVSKDDIEELLSSGHTTDYNSKIYLSKGDVLYSNRSNPMLTIIRTASVVGLTKAVAIESLSWKKNRATASTIASAISRLRPRTR